MLICRQPVPPSRSNAPATSLLVAFMALAGRPGMARADPPEAGHALPKTARSPDAERSIAPAECQVTSADVSWVRAEGAEACPSAAEIRGEVMRRLGKPSGTPGEGKVVEVTIEKTADGWSARIVASGCGTERAVRALTSTAPTCDPIASAAALVIALAVDPLAALAGPAGPQKTASPTSPPVNQPPVSQPPVSQSPVSQPPISPPPGSAASSRAPPSAPQEPWAPAPAAVAPAVETRLTFRGALAAGLLPVVAPGLAWSGEWRFSRWLVVSTGVLFLPEQPAENPTFAFGMTTGWAGVCTDVLRLFERLSAGPCARVLAGTIHAVVHTHPSIIGTGPGQRGWAGGAAGAHLSARVVGPFVAEASAEVVVPFTRYAFKLRDVPEPVFLQPPVATLLYIGAGLTFP